MITVPASDRNGKTLHVTPSRDFMDRVTLRVDKPVKGEWREVIMPRLKPHDARALGRALIELAGDAPAPAPEGDAE